MSITSNLKELIGSLPANVKLIAVSKTKPVSDILEAYACGQRIFAENKVQEMSQKHLQLPKDIEWHMIGHLQTNKVKYISSFVSLIHSVDSIKLLEVINKEAKRNNRIIKYLFQIHIAKEESKFGLNLDELKIILKSKEFKSFSNVSLLGLMGMATFTDNEDVIRSEFEEIKKCFDLIKNEFLPFSQEFCELSIGMSSDYKIAIDLGSTMVRIGSFIFGER